MSAQGRPKRELLPLGGKARSAKGAPMSVAGEAKDGPSRRHAIARARRATSRLHCRL
jgi:hypothetical protein